MQVDQSKLFPSFSEIGLNPSEVYWNLSPENLVKKTVELGQGHLSDTGALCVDTGAFTGRSPKDRFIVRDHITDQTVNWGDINIPLSPPVFDSLYQKMCAYLNSREIWARDCEACADPRYKLSIRVVTETPWANLFCHHLFIRPERNSFRMQSGSWLILQAPGFEAGPGDGTRRGNFTIINFTKRTILIGGTAYTGEIKKAIFSVLNFLMPSSHGVLPMHCSANETAGGNVSLFFGLSGTGKTTLSANPRHTLIGDDEHGWGSGSIFNFEGGCYAKVISLNPEKEPQIYKAIRADTLLENTRFKEGTPEVNYEDSSVTENTRAAYPLSYVTGSKLPSVGREPNNIFFLTCDAFGVLPPLALLDWRQAMYHFISGYTSKIAGTEMGINQPQPIFSACFGEVFLPLHPMEYASLFGRQLRGTKGIRVWLVNTGWSGGSFGTGKRLPLAYTRTLIDAAVSGMLQEGDFETEPVFGLKIPLKVSDVPRQLLSPRNAWTDKAGYDVKASELKKLFAKNLGRYEGRISPEILAVGQLLLIIIINLQITV